MMTIPNIIDPSVPIGKDDSENDLKEVLESLTKTAPIKYESVDNKIKVMKKKA